MGMLVGLFSSFLLIVLGPQVMVDVMGMEKAIFPYTYPTVISVPLAFLAIWYFSVTDTSQSAIKEREAYYEQFVLSESGVAVSEASDH